MKQSESHKERDYQFMNEELNLLFSQLHHGQEDWYANIFHQYHEAIAICEAESGFPSTIIDCNLSFEHLIKYQSLDLIGSDFMNLLAPGEKRKFFIKALGETEDDSIQHLPIHFELGNKMQQTFALSIAKLDKKNGHLLLITLHPNTEKQAIIEQGVEQLHSHLKQVFCSLKNHDILQFNYISQSAIEVLGYSSEQLLLNPFLFWFNCHPEDFNHLKKTWQKTHHLSESIEVRFIHKNGHMIWLQLSMIKNTNHTKQANQHYLLIQEISYTKKIERLEEKKNNYRHLLLHSAKQLLSEGQDKALAALINTVGRNFSADRIAIYAINNGAIILNHNYFRSSLDYDAISDHISAHYYFSEFKQELAEQPLILYHPDAQCEALEKKHYRFLKNRHLASALIVPLRLHQKLVGLILCVNQKYSPCWDRSDMYFMHEIGEITKSYLSNKETHKTLKKPPQKGL